ncbi:DML1 [Sanghuangporus vaninii]
MKEIIYIQAGNISNHIGTHFWNSQEDYFTYDNDSEPLVNHDISFREGVSDQNEPTYCPRVLIFDHKSNFGPLSKYNELYPEVRDSEQPFQKGLWNGAISEYRQEAIPKSEYQKRLDDGEDRVEDYLENNKSSNMRFWSDFNRVYYIPRSIQQVPDLPEWEANRGDWNHGKNVFERYNLDASLDEGSLRKFIEESNHSQGFQVSFDNNSFGGFTVRLLESIRDDFPKIPILIFPVLSGVDPSKVDFEDVRMRKASLQDAVCLCSLNELETQSIPVQSPLFWRFRKWSELLNLENSNTYQSSALLSALIESATLPLRIKGGNEELSDFCTQLNWAQNTRISRLSGVIPYQEEDQLDNITYDFSALLGQDPKNNGRCLAQRTVSRGLNINQARKVDAYFASCTGLDDPYIKSNHSAAYPLPSSFPSIFHPGVIRFSNPLTQRLGSTSSGTERNISLLSVLRTTTSTTDTLRSYATLSQSCVVRRYSGLDTAGLDADELRDMVEKLTAMAESYAGEGEEESEEPEEEDIYEEE